jgi:predicted TIM-barrel fold metal-dependent hydrolase
VSHLKDDLLKSSLSEEQKYDVLCGNAKRLFGLDDPEQA